MKSNVQVIPKILAEKLEAHARTIREFIAGQRRGAAEQFGFAFLAGRALLQAKGIVPNGNKKRPNAGFRIWVEVNFPEITVRTAENWMAFANEIMTRAQVASPDSPMLLGPGEMNGKTHESILQLVPEVMDGRGMMKFMRECRLLLPIRKPKRNAEKPDPSVREKREEAARARRVWRRILAEVHIGAKLLRCVQKKDDLKRYLEALEVTTEKIRGALEDGNAKT